MLFLTSGRKMFNFLKIENYTSLKREKKLRENTSRVLEMKISLAWKNFQHELRWEREEWKKFHVIMRREKFPKNQSKMSLNLRF